MARLALGAALTLLLATTTLAHASDVSDDTAAVAAETGKDPEALQGAVNTTGLSPRDYLIAVGEVIVPTPPTSSTITSAAVDRRVDCIIARESHGNPNAVNPRSHASGLGQFLPSTWRTTPQGRAGMSVFNPAANRAAVAWMLQVGRGREFATIGLC